MEKKSILTLTCFIFLAITSVTPADALYYYNELLPGDLIINEIMQDPDNISDSNGEYFEIYNFLGDVDIRGMEIWDLGSNYHLISGDDPVIVPYQGFFVLGNNGDPASNGGINVDYEYSGISLGNSDDELYIGVEGVTVIDSVEWDGGPEFPDPTGASMEFNPYFLYTSSSPQEDNDYGQNWNVASSSWPGSSGDYGSPGLPNTVPIPGTFWLLSSGIIGFLGFRKRNRK